MSDLPDAPPVASVPAAPVIAPASEPMQTPMSPAAIERFLKSPVVAVISWITRKGEVASSPVWFEYTGGKFLVHAANTSLKARSIRRNPSVAICLQDAAPPYRYVAARTTARIIDHAAHGRALDERLSRRYLGRTAGNYYMKNVYPTFPGESCIIELTPTHVTSVDGTSEINPVARVAMTVMRHAGL